MLYIGEQVCLCVSRSCIADCVVSHVPIEQVGGAVGILEAFKCLVMTHIDMIRRRSQQTLTRKQRTTFSDTVLENTELDNAIASPPTEEGFTLSDAEIEACCRDILVLCNRTQSGGDTYFCVEALLAKCGLSIPQCAFRYANLSPYDCESDPLKITVDVVDYVIEGGNSHIVCTDDMEQRDRDRFTDSIRMFIDNTAAKRASINLKDASILSASIHNSMSNSTSQSHTNSPVGSARYNPLNAGTVPNSARDHHSSSMHSVHSVGAGVAGHSYSREGGSDTELGGSSLSRTFSKLASSLTTHSYTHTQSMDALGDTATTTSTHTTMSESSLLTYQANAQTHQHHTPPIVGKLNLAAVDKANSLHHHHAHAHQHASHNIYSALLAPSPRDVAGTHHSQTHTHPGGTSNSNYELHVKRNTGGVHDTISPTTPHTPSTPSPTPAGTPVTHKSSNKLHIDTVAAAAVTMSSQQHQHQYPREHGNQHGHALNHIKRTSSRNDDDDDGSSSDYTSVTESDADINDINEQYTMHSARTQQQQQQQQQQRKRTSTGASSTSHGTNTPSSSNTGTFSTTYRSPVRSTSQNGAARGARGVAFNDNVTSGRLREDNESMYITQRSVSQNSGGAGSASRRNRVSPRPSFAGAGGTRSERNSFGGPLPSITRPKSRKSSDGGPSNISPPSSSHTLTRRRSATTGADSVTKSITFEDEDVVDVDGLMKQDAQDSSRRSSNDDSRRSSNENNVGDQFNIVTVRRGTTSPTDSPMLSPLMKATALGHSRLQAHSHDHDLGGSRSPDIGQTIVTAFDAASTAYAEESPSSGMSSRDVSPRPGGSRYTFSTSSTHTNTFITNNSSNYNASSNASHSHSNSSNENSYEMQQKHSEHNLARTTAAALAAINHRRENKATSGKVRYTIDLDLDNEEGDTGTKGKGEYALKAPTVFTGRSDISNKSYNSARTNTSRGDERDDEDDYDDMDNNVSSPPGKDVDLKMPVPAPIHMLPATESQSSVQGHQQSAGLQGYGHGRRHRGSNASSVAYDDMGDVDTADVWSDVESTSEYVTSSAPNTAREMYGRAGGTASAPAAVGPGGMITVSSFSYSNNNTTRTSLSPTPGSAPVPSAANVPESVFISPRRSLNRKQSVVYRNANTEGHSHRKGSVSHSQSVQNASHLWTRIDDDDRDPAASTGNMGTGPAIKKELSVSLDGTTMSGKGKGNKSLFTRFANSLSSPFTPKKEKNKDKDGKGVPASSVSSELDLDLTGQQQPQMGVGGKNYFIRNPFASPSLPSTTPGQSAANTPRRPSAGSTGSLNNSNDGPGGAAVVSPPPAPPPPCVRVTFHLDSRYKLCCADPQGDFSDNWAIINSQFTQVSLKTVVLLGLYSVVTLLYVVLFRCSTFTPTVRAELQRLIDSSLFDSKNLWKI
jgi:hypothetical protein